MQRGQTQGRESTYIYTTFISLLHSQAFQHVVIQKKKNDAENKATSEAGRHMIGKVQ